MIDKNANQGEKAVGTSSACIKSMSFVMFAAPK
jgi:hypothetical protein